MLALCDSSLDAGRLCPENVCMHPESLRALLRKVHDGSCSIEQALAELAQAVKARSPSTRILMYSANPPEDCPFLDGVIHKPAHLLDLKDAVDRLLAAGPPPGR